ncbi:hypothetical protein [Mangrovibacterium diazotrophicum]|uniref:LTXXQ motif family protein n=1 Tax=Mangrovibacterium diazotrophicum TaxID=1261403 RepID=A0A419W9F2_9BACT|nr:hypothetical protein [Mangrovibacterium diazotrophicum]RKD92044.1 hypothetical protein BC643_2414 [Mangrovibacterium diazotrophicum]
MKKLVLTLAVVIGLIINCSAQQENGQRTPEERAAAQTEWMKENMALTTEQLSTVEALNLEYANKMEEVRAIDGNLAKLKKARSITDEKDAKLKTVLNKEQFQQYEEMKKEMRAKAKQMHKEQQQ